MDEAEIEETVALVPPLLRALETLNFASRHLHPPSMAQLAPVLAPAEAPLRAAVASRTPVEKSTPLRELLDSAAEATLAAFDALNAAFSEGGDLGQVYRAFRNVPRAQETLYRLVVLPPISRYFTDPPMRGDEALAARLASAEESDVTGVQHYSNEMSSRGGFSLYVPEYYSPEQSWPLIFALHGGAGHGRGFLWSWLAVARSYGAILVTPTSTGNTWALQGPDTDTPNLERIVEHVTSNWNVDREHMLLTGMSDGGTFSYLSGLETTSPFTHLAPIAAAFHPMLVSFAAAERVRGLPVRITHGALDWMFSVEMAREAAKYLEAAGANVSLVELADLSHTYPREQNAQIIQWMLEN